MTGTVVTDVSEPEARRALESALVNLRFLFQQGDRVFKGRESARRSKAYTPIRDVLRYGTSVDGFLFFQDALVSAGAIFEEVDGAPDEFSSWEEPHPPLSLKAVEEQWEPVAECVELMISALKGSALVPTNDAEGFASPAKKRKVTPTLASDDEDDVVPDTTFCPPKGGMGLGAGDGVTVRPPGTPGAPGPSDLRLGGQPLNDAALDALNGGFAGFGGTGATGGIFCQTVGSTPSLLYRMPAVKKRSRSELRVENGVPTMVSVGVPEFHKFVSFTSRTLLALPLEKRDGYRDLVELCISFTKDNDFESVYSFYEDVCDDLEAGRISRFDEAKLYVQFMHTYGAAGLRKSLGGTLGANPSSPNPGAPTTPGRPDGPTKVKSCHFYNSAKASVKCTRNPCQFPHVCSKCGGNHPKRDCKK